MNTEKAIIYTSVSETKGPKLLQKSTSYDNTTSFGKKGVQSSTRDPEFYSFEHSSHVSLAVVVAVLPRARVVNKLLSYCVYFFFWKWRGAKKGSTNQNQRKENKKERRRSCCPFFISFAKREEPSFSNIIFQDWWDIWHTSHKINHFSWNALLSKHKV